MPVAPAPRPSVGTPAAAASPSADNPIGVFDSGVGGLTVVSAIRRHLPAESVLYLGDTARLPYGTKSPETVARYTHRNIDFLVSRGVKAVVIACNTASAVLYDHLELPLPVWGVVEPGADAAVAAARGEPIGVLATESTIRSDAYGRAIRRRDPTARVLGQACPLFVPLVEEGWHDDPITHQVAERYLGPVLDREARTLVLGCTHYPRLRRVLKQVASRLTESGQVELIDSAEAVAHLLEAELDRLDLRRSPSAGPATLHLCVTDVAERFRRIARDLLDSDGRGTSGGEADGDGPRDPIASRDLQLTTTNRTTPSGAQSSGEESESGPLSLEWVEV
ncbi:MAG: glutamate racemase [Holophagales bacterium]|nr:glutamate racemase [Holophagales bacterium]